MSRSHLDTGPEAGQPAQTAGVAISVGEGTIGIITPTTEIAGYLRSLIPYYSVSLEQVDPDELYRVTRVEDGWQVALHDTDIMDTLGTLEDALNALEQLAATRLLAITPRTAQVHAAGTVVNGSAILSLGAAGAGKTSIALRWSASKLPVLGDDLVFLDADGIARPFKRLFIAPAERLSQLGLGPEPDLSWLGDEKEAWFDPQAAGGWAEPAPVSTLAIVQFVPAEEMTVSEITKPEALSALLTSLFPSGMNSDQAFERCATAVQRSRTLRIRFSDSVQAADFLASLH